MCPYNFPMRQTVVKVIWEGNFWCYCVHWPVLVWNRILIRSYDFQTPDFVFNFYFLYLTTSVLFSKTWFMCADHLYILWLLFSNKIFISFILEMFPRQLWDFEPWPVYSDHVSMIWKKSWLPYSDHVSD